MSSIVSHLQLEALDRNVRVSDLLRKSLVVARKLKLSELQSSIEKELSGYRQTDEVTDYREVISIHLND
jgi:AbiTii-like protein